MPVFIFWSEKFWAMGIKKKKRRGGSQPPKKRSATNKAIAAIVWEVGEPLVSSENMELVHVESIHGDGSRIIRLYIDKEGGVTLDNCIDISRQMGDLLDVALEGDDPYRLEVSSPGVDRPLSRKQDFDRFAGKKVRIKIDKPVNGQANFTGILKGTKDEDVEIMTGDKTVAIAFDAITKARLVVDNGDSDPCS